MYLDGIFQTLRIYLEWTISTGSLPSGEEQETSLLLKSAAMSQRCSRAALTLTISSKVCLEIATLSHLSPLSLNGLIESRESLSQIKLMLKVCLESICILMVFSKLSGLMTTSQSSIKRSLP